MNRGQRVLLLSALVLFAMLPTVLMAKGPGEDRVHFFQSINVGADETVGDVVCIGCSIRMSGTSGDTVAIFGSILVDGTVKGDAVAVGGAIRLGEDAQVMGDTVGLGGGIAKHPNAVVKGEVVSQAGPLIFIGLFLGGVVIPLLPIILIIWLIVWLVRRDRPAPSAPTAYR
jgi:hypothetical protein